MVLVAKQSCRSSKPPTISMKPIDPTPWNPLPSHPGDLIEQIKFNHLDAYLTQLGILTGDLCFKKLFEPLP